MKMQPQNYQSVDEKVTHFIRESKKELGITSTKKLARIVSGIFATIRQSLSPQETKVFVSRLPSLLQLLFISNWKYHERQVTINHLDELVEVLRNQESKSTNPIFHSEIEALNAAVVILKKLDKMIGLLDFDGFKFSLVQELRQVPLDDAA